MLSPDFFKDVSAFGVLICGIAVMVTAAINICRGMLKRPEPQRPFPEIQPNGPRLPAAWSITETQHTQVKSKSPRTKKATTSTCPKCCGLLEIVNTDITDDGTVFTRRCRNCNFVEVLPETEAGL